MTVITFLIGAQWCVMAVNQLVEILPAQELLPLPSKGPNGALPNEVEMVGIVDYRGKAIPVIRLHLDPSVDTKEGLAGSAGPYRRRFLVLGGGPPSALEVNRVNAVVELDEHSIQPPGEVGLRDYPVISGVCRLNDAYAFMIDGTALNTGQCVAGLPGGTRGASNG
jgi:chemotaxis signal transduction protein